MHLLTSLHLEIIIFRPDLLFEDSNFCTLTASLLQLLPQLLEFLDILRE